MKTAERRRSEILVGRVQKNEDRKAASAQKIEVERIRTASSFGRKNHRSKVTFPHHRLRTAPVLVCWT